MQIRQFIFALLIVSSSVWADPYEDGYAAYERNDYPQALKLFRLSAAQGDAAAMYNLGILYSKEEGVVKDYAEAVKWFRLSAAQGFAMSQHQLGVMYASGKGVAKDYVRAHSWLNLSAAQGLRHSLKYRDFIANKMTPQQLSEAQKLARDCQARNLKGCN